MEIRLTSENVVIMAATVAAVSSVITLLLNHILDLRKQKKMSQWQLDFERLSQLEELAGKAKELALSYASPEVVEAEFVPIHDTLRHEAGKLSRYPKLANTIRELNHACAIVVARPTDGSVEREWRAKIAPAYEALLQECDRITRRK